MEVAVGARVQRAAAHRDAPEASWSWAQAAPPADPPTAAPDRVAGADSLGAAQTHGGATEMQAKAGDTAMKRTKESEQQRRSLLAF